ncbi:MAG: DMT family transporter [Bacteroidales bacterium]|nr:DMT family transporter [Bacteroidales bacterium]
MSRNLFKVYAGLAFSILVWSYSFVMIKVCYQHGFTPLLLVNLRLLMGFIILFMVCYFGKYLQSIERKDFYRFFLLAFFEPFLYYIGESISLTYVTASTASVFIGTIPVFTPFFMFFIYGEKIRKSVLFSTIFSFIGVLLIFYSEIQLSVNPVGFLFLLLSIGSAIGYTIFVKELSAKYNPFFIVFVQQLIGFFLFLPWVVFSEAEYAPYIKWNVEIFLYVIILAFFASSLAYVFYTISIERIGVVRTSIFSNLIPVLTVIGSLLYGLEKPQALKIVGILLVIGSIFFLQYTHSRNFIQLANKAKNFFKKDQSN